MLSLTIPSLLAPGNLPEFKKSFPVSIHIYTTSRDAEYISSHPSVIRFQDIIPISCHVVDDIDLSERYGAMSAYTREAFRDCSRAGCGLLLHNPDAVWGNGSFGHVASVFRKGYRFVACTGIRIVSNRFPFEIRDRFLQPDHTLAIPHEQLVEAGLRYIHSLWTASMDGAYASSSHPSVYGQVVPGVGFSQHYAHITSFAFNLDSYPTEFSGTVDQDLAEYCGLKPSEIYLSQSSSEISMVELSDSLRFLEALQPRMENTPLMEAYWLMQQGSLTETTFRLYRKPCIISASHGDRTGKAQAGAAALSCRHVARTVFLRGVILLLKAAVKRGCQKAASLALYLSEAGDLGAEDFPFREATILLPVDEAFSGWGESDEEMADKVSDVPKLLEILKSHVIEGIVENPLAAAEQAVTATGERLSESVKGCQARVLESFRLDEVRQVVLVDRLISDF